CSASGRSTSTPRSEPIPLRHLPNQSVQEPACRDERSKSAARMSKHRNARRDGKRRPTPPCASSVANQETDENKRRLKDKSEHRLHPVIPPRFMIARKGRH